MKDTPDHIKKMQLQIWLAKSPGERLRQAIEDNDALFAFWADAKLQFAQTGNKSQALNIK
jgi:hypothetical protein